MLPVKAKTFIEEFCQIYGYDNVADIEYIIMELYRDMKNHQIAMDYECIVMPAMGQFFLKSWTLQSENVSLSKRYHAPQISDFSRKQYLKKLDKYVPIVEKMNIMFRARAAERFANIGEFRYKLNNKPPHMQGIPEPSAGSYFNHGCRCVECTEQARIFQKRMKENRHNKIKQKLSQQQNNDTPGEIHEGLG